MKRAIVRNEPIVFDSKRANLSERTDLKHSQNKLGFLTRKQFQVLLLRSKGYSQHEVASELQMSRSSVSMIEARARRQIERGRQTLEIYHEITEKTQHVITIEKGTHLQRIPMIVLIAADRYHIHLQKNMVEILKIVKSRKADCLSGGNTIKRIKFSINERGKLKLA